MHDSLKFGHLAAGLVDRLYKTYFIINYIVNYL